MSHPNKPVPTPFEESIDQNQFKERQKQEEEYVHKVYNDIASHFSNTRYKPWPIIERFLNSLPEHSIGADIGCGNGKYMGVNKKLMVMGSDRSSNLIEICSERGFEALVADNLTLPYRDNAFDFCISVAVIHHLTTNERRKKAVQELIRIIKPGGKLLVYVWALEQKSRRDFDPNVQDVLVPWVLNKSFTQDNEDKVYQRYYHLFKQGELEELVLSTDNKLQMINSGYDKDNWYIEVIKE
ncbi:S-adenosyl-L-methionine-dependent methyltransferase [Neoconidiobolus thromboides FSU 785]|nr:S-adenosyl-L-methionine-dependent methyltransferase [Neoconidiobolus thromboides FSU 785]